jgi:hypothetical protein
MNEYFSSRPNTHKLCIITRGWMRDSATILKCHFTLPYILPLHSILQNPISLTPCTGLDTLFSKIEPFKVASPNCESAKVAASDACI